MKRRGFFGALLGVAAAPVAAKAVQAIDDAGFVEDIPELPVARVASPQELPAMSSYMYASGSAGISCSFASPTDPGFIVWPD